MQSLELKQIQGKNQMSEVIATPAEPVVPTEPVEPIDTALSGATPTEPPIDTPAEPVIPEEYKVEIEGFDFEAFKAIESNNELLGRAKELGLSNDQVQFMLKEYNDIIPQVFEAHLQLDTEKTVTGLKELWGNDYDASLGNAVKALKAAGFTDEDLSNPAVGNNFELAKLAAHFGGQMKEDNLPNNQTPATVKFDVSTLLSHAAYNNPAHPEYKTVMDQIDQHYAKSNR